MVASTPGKLEQFGMPERGQLSDILTFPALSRRPSVDSGDPGLSRCCPDSSLTTLSAFVPVFFRDVGTRTETTISPWPGDDVLLRLSIVITGGFGFGSSDVGLHRSKFALRKQPGKDSDFWSRSIEGIVFGEFSKFGFKLS